MSLSIFDFTSKAMAFMLVGLALWHFAIAFLRTRGMATIVLAIVGTITMFTALKMFSVLFIQNIDFNDLSVIVMKSSMVSLASLGIAGVTEILRLRVRD